MALTIKNTFIKEDILNESGDKIGELKFNPNDSRIMKALSQIVNDFSKAIKEIDKLGKIEEISNEKLKTIEDFEKASETFKKIDKGYDIEVEAVNKMINGLSEIFGNETINLFTQGTKDADCLLPIIEFISPFVEKNRKLKVDKYLKNSERSDVME